MEPIITKGRFDEASAMYPPNAYTKFIYNHFSKSGIQEGFKIGDVVFYLLAASFITGFVATVIDGPRTIIAAVTYFYVCLLILIVPAIFIAFIMNRNRIKNIIEELGITDEEYNTLLDIYYPNRPGR